MDRYIYILDDDFTTAYMLKQLIEGGFPNYHTDTCDQPDEVLHQLYKRSEKRAEQWVFVDGHHPVFAMPQVLADFLSKLQAELNEVRVVMMGRYSDNELTAVLHDFPEYAPILKKPLTSGVLTDVFSAVSLN